ncbi:hypothetical protein EGJ57_13095 [Brucella anthropi]|uniref:GAP1-N1 domain-containing protein n=1 Tax=Brucella anthropi TaxID=529 RepID=UPI000F6792C0|nr:hypothetical protein [Brucella anthropi]RRY07792.1 hypothetical protein EGJ58_15195 [Brucella anthropi]RRY18637.1 hypothetical protein EGJ57_13095 [Brucella anthropi]
MTNDDKNEVHQAVFGYSNGHRMLASSIQLSSIDNYELAAASDLAPGVSLDPSANYLTGVGLPESKLYAFIKTWAAPEMQRPGCVWSHVLLLSRPFLSSQIDLAALSPLFRRPSGYQSDHAFSKPLLVGRRERAPSPPIGAVQQALLACYESAVLDGSREKRSEVERAILAVWSQQWPRMRSVFVFRSVQSSSLLPNQAIRLRSDTDEPATRITDKPWLSVATDDAVAEAVTPLRRFLWRYGKDIDPAQQPFIELVEIFMQLEGKRPSYEDTAQIFSRFGGGQALTLKRDILGVASTKAALVRSVEAADIIRLMVEYDFADFGVKKDDLGGLFQHMDPLVLPGVARALDKFQVALGDHYGVIFDAILPLFTQSVLVSGAIPSGLAFEVVKRRRDLISLRILERFSDNELSALFDLDLSKTETRELILAIMSRPPIGRASTVIERFPEVCLDVAVAQQQRGGLGGEWRSILNDAAERLLPFVLDLRNDGSLLDAARAMNFPLSPAEAPNTWMSAFRKYRGLLDRSSETSLMTFIMVLCIRHQLDNTREIAVEIMPDLRWRILSRILSPEDEKMLDRWLPNTSDRGDLNKRLLKLLRQGYKKGANYDDLVLPLGLSDEEYAYTTNQDPDNLVRQVARMFMPWGRREN